MADMGTRDTARADMADTEGRDTATTRRGPSAALSGVLVLLLALVAAGVLWWLWSGDGVLVVAPPGTAVQEGQQVRVTGTIRDFAWDPGLGDEAAFDDWAGRSAIVADDVTPVDGEPQGAQDLDDIGDAGVAGRSVTVVGEVDELVGPRSFVLDD